MSIELKKTLADAICTAVTVGFFKTIGNQTEFIYENEKDKAAHDTLKDYLKQIDSGLCINFNLQQEGKFFVIAKTAKINQDTQLLINDINHYMAQITDAATVGEFYGAYIGGLVKQDNLIEFSGTSSLKVYDKPTLRYKWNINLDDETISKAFDSAKKIITDTNNHLIKAISKYQETSFRTGMPKFRFVDDYKLESPDKIDTGKLFGSIHGLVRVIIEYNLTNKGVGADTECTCCEYAYTKETKKIASCIPCSIFAASNNTPANYTHLGRGDYWNFPDINSKHITKDNLNNKKGQWIKYVSDCFNIGYNALKKDGNTMPLGLDDVYALSPEEKSEIFLHSLMFEGKFIDKINNILAQILPKKKY